MDKMPTLIDSSHGPPHVHFNEPPGSSRWGGRALPHRDEPGGSFRCVFRSDTWQFRQDPLPSAERGTYPKMVRLRKRNADRSGFAPTRAPWALSMYPSPSDRFSAACGLAEPLELEVRWPEQPSTRYPFQRPWIRGWPCFPLDLVPRRCRRQPAPCVSPDARGPSLRPRPGKPNRHPVRRHFQAPVGSNQDRT